MNSSETTVEIVRFHLNDGVDRDAFLAIMQESQSFIGACEGFISRHTSCDAQGLWTDYTLWASPEAAKAAQDAFMDQPFAVPLVSQIDKDRFEMIHAPILASAMAA